MKTIFSTRASRRAMLCVGLLLVGVASVYVWMKVPRNLTPSFIETIRSFGGRPAQTNGLPEIKARWSLREDQNGFEITVHGAEYQNVQAMVQQAFGGKGDVTLDEGKATACLFRASDIGVAIMMERTPDGAQINCVRGAGRDLPLRGLGAVSRKEVKP